MSSIFYSRFRGEFQVLFSLFQCDGDAQYLSVSEYLYFDDITNLAAPQSVSEIVKVLDWLIAKLDHHITRLESGLGGGRSGLDVREFDSIFYLAKIPNGAVIRAVAAPAAARRRLVFYHRNKGGPVRCRGDLARDIGNQVQQTHRRISIDFFPRVGGLVVVRVESGKKEKHRNALCDEGRMIAGSITTGGVFDLKVRFALRLFQRAFEGGTGPHTADVNLVILDSTDHVHVQHGHRFVQRHSRVFDPLSGAQQS